MWGDREGKGGGGELKDSLFWDQDTKSLSIPGHLDSPGSLCGRFRADQAAGRPKSIREGSSYAISSWCLWWERQEAAGNFPGTQHAPQCPSRKHNGIVAREPDGLYSRQRQRRGDGDRICWLLSLAAGPLSWHWIYLSLVPKGRVQPSWVLWKPWVCWSAHSLCLFLCGQGNRWLRPHSREPSWLSPH